LLLLLLLLLLLIYLLLVLVLFLVLLGMAVFFIYGTSAGLTRVIMLTVPIETRTVTTTDTTTTTTTTTIAANTSTSAVPRSARSGCLFYLRHLSRPHQSYHAHRSSRNTYATMTYTTTNSSSINLPITSTSAVPRSARGCCLLIYGTSAGLTRVIMLTVPVETRMQL